MKSHNSSQRLAAKLRKVALMSKAGNRMSKAGERTTVCLRLLFSVGCLVGFIIQVSLFLNGYLLFQTRKETNTAIDTDLSVPALAFCFDKGIRIEDYRGYFDLEKANTTKPAINCSGTNDKKAKPNSCSFWDWFYTKWKGMCFVYNGNLSGKVETVSIQSEEKKAYELGAAETDKLYFVIHDDHRLPNVKVEKQILYSGGQSATYKFTKTINILLPPPHSTGCRDYEKDYIQKNRTGPLSKDKCIMDCIAQNSKASVGCVDLNRISGRPEGTPMPSDLMPYVCNRTEKEWPEAEFKQAFDTCVERCPIECWYQVFDAQVYQGGSFKQDSQSKQLTISYMSSETTIVTHVPEYQAVEVFSFIGGYLGIWLGISLMKLPEHIQTIWLAIEKRRAVIKQSKTVVEKDRNKRRRKQFSISFM